MENISPTFPSPQGSRRGLFCNYSVSSSNGPLSTIYISRTHFDMRHPEVPFQALLPESIVSLQEYLKSKGILTNYTATELRILIWYRKCYLSYQLKQLDLNTASRFPGMWAPFQFGYIEGRDCFFQIPKFWRNTLKVMIDHETDYQDVDEIHTDEDIELMAFLNIKPNNFLSKDIIESVDYAGDVWGIEARRRRLLRWEKLGLPLRGNLIFRDHDCKDDDDALVIMAG